MGSSCFARGNEKTVEACESFMAERGLKDEMDVDLGASLCTGNCADGPIVVVDGKIYKHVDPLVMRILTVPPFYKETWSFAAASSSALPPPSRRTTARKSR